MHRNLKTSVISLGGKLGKHPNVHTEGKEATPGLKLHAELWGLVGCSRLEPTTHRVLFTLSDVTLISPQAFFPLLLF